MKYPLALGEFLGQIVQSHRRRAGRGILVQEKYGNPLIDFAAGKTAHVSRTGGRNHFIAQEVVPDPQRPADGRESVVTRQCIEYAAVELTVDIVSVPELGERIRGLQQLALVECDQRAEIGRRSVPRACPAANSVNMILSRFVCGAYSAIALWRSEPVHGGLEQLLSRGRRPILGWWPVARLIRHDHARLGTDSRQTLMNSSKSSGSMCQLPSGDVRETPAGIQAAGAGHASAGRLDVYGGTDQRLIADFHPPG
jgi:hypothetical protein